LTTILSTKGNIQAQNQFIAKWLRLALRIQSFCLPPNGGDCLQQNPSCDVSSVRGSGAGVKELVFNFFVTAKPR
jgi:hypothetical protein